MFRASRVVLSALRPLKASTNITGLAVHPDPLPALTSIYTSTLSSLSQLPAASVYRQATEALTKYRLAIVEKAQGDVEKVESELGSIVEIVIEEAKSEEGLVVKMKDWKSWEGLMEEPHPGQWRYFEPLSDE
ncbi:hypothetical protein CNBM2110 [Cryptococcus deneoformans B-3501A]|uniref:NADH dehydrogenase (Ubiquinone) 1 alpha subcomplex 5 n=1 Tax=Cryptococcus deneoformans (strain JEC21 / ATCC MYA-565) TaxID=214684 RepID=Q5K7J0_CRYD1|nr:conserved hypothetical protein [Cryptococcus neoformans var. neoformans JEC21]XP_772054.1 hypothetical protein CNBM2110 [Cryptococcus neoformans var. neoformans B-3501A]AAW46747.1 conserved hypothetical protein [Cryptococcus neoformans var. neoformans JEC21]EAL17407.1 hypothetical protein CNBM2110 [Cryptococcus neoformans var. neoformans B-3501A]